MKIRQRRRPAHCKVERVTNGLARHVLPVRSISRLITGFNLFFWLTLHVLLVRKHEQYCLLEVLLLEHRLRRDKNETRWLSKRRK